MALWCDLQTGLTPSSPLSSCFPRSNFADLPTIIKHLSDVYHWIITASCKGGNWQGWNYKVAQNMQRKRMCYLQAVVRTQSKLWKRKHLLRLKWIICCFNHIFFLCPPQCYSGNLLGAELHLELPSVMCKTAASRLCSFIFPPKGAPIPKEGQI